MSLLQPVTSYRPRLVVCYSILSAQVTEVDNLYTSIACSCSDDWSQLITILWYSGGFSAVLSMCTLQTLCVCVCVCACARVCVCACACVCVCRWWQQRSMSAQYSTLWVGCCWRSTCMTDTLLTLSTTPSTSWMTPSTTRQSSHVLSCSTAVSIWALAAAWTYFFHLSLSSVILTNFHGESCPRLDVVHPGRAWPSSPACTWHCSLHYLFLQATPLFPRGRPTVVFSQSQDRVGCFS